LIEVTVVGGWGLAALGGEFDLANAAQIGSVVEHLIGQAVTELTADLSRVTFLDASTIRELVTCNERLSGVNGRMVVVGATPWVRQVFAAAGVGETLPVAAVPAIADGQCAGGVVTAPTLAEQRSAEDALTRHFFELVGALLSESTVTGDLRRVVHAAVSTIGGCVAASVTVMALGEQRSAVVSDRVAAEVDVAQYVLNEGPCLEAAGRSGRIRLDVMADDRFAGFAPLAAERGIRAVLSVPVVLAGQTLGSLNLYSDSEFDGDADAMGDLLAGQVAAAVAKSDLLAEAEQSARAERRSDDLRAVSSAEGVLAGLHRISTDQAGRLLHSTADVDNETLVQAARRIIYDVAGQ
jgi:anti-anti-sigma factor